MKNLSVLPHANNSVRRQQDIGYLSMPEVQGYQEVSLGDYLHVFWRRKWLVLLPLLVLIPFVLMDIITQRPMYVATATVMIEDTNPKILVVTEVSGPDKSPDFYNTQYEIIKSRSIAEEVVDKLRLYARQPKPDAPLVAALKTVKRFPHHLFGMLIHKIMALLKGGTDRISSTSDNAVAETAPRHRDALHRQSVITNFQDAIEVKPRDETKLVDISVKGDTPAEVVRQVNTLAEVYVQRNLENKLDASRKAAVWLRKEAHSLRDTIQQAEQVLHAYKEAKKIIASATENHTGRADAEVLSKLQLAYAEKKRERITLRSEISALPEIANGNPNDPMLLGHTILNSLRKESIDLQSEYDKLSKTFGHKHPKLVALKTQLEAVRKATRREIQQTIGSMESRYNAVVTQENEIKALLDEQKKDLIWADKDITEYEALKRDLEIQKSMYSEVSKRLAETTLTAALTANNVQLVERAVQASPGSSGAIIKLFAGFILGLGGGAALAFLAEYRDRRFKGIREAEQYLGLPFLGIIPYHRLSKRSTARLITLQEPWAVASEAYRRLRTWIQLSEAPIKTLLITSALSGEGKSTTSANLAVSFAQLGRRVLLVDMDLRRPSIHGAFGLANTQGLADLLGAYDLEWQSILQTSPLENLVVLTSGPIPGNPTELLHTPRMQQLIESWKACFDTIIVDAPPTLSIPDVMVLAPGMDGVVLVHQQRRSNRDTALEAKTILERARANLLGMIFNNVTSKEERDYYTYQSKYAYNYGHPSDGADAAMSAPHSWAQSVDKPRFLSS